MSFETTASVTTSRNLIFIVGPQAVGKMTVGHAICERTWYRLFLNHMSIELALNFFDFSDDGFRELSETIRQSVFKTVAESDAPGLVFTFVWAFDLDSEARYVERVAADWRCRTGGGFYVLELEASLEKRVARNRHPDRLAAKPSKRNVAASEANLRDFHERYQLNSGGTLPIDVPHVTIDNETLSADATAERFLALAGLT